MPRLPRSALRFPPIDRSLQTDARAEPARPEGGVASRSSDIVLPATFGGMVGELIAERFELEELVGRRRDVERLPRARPPARAARGDQDPPRLGGCGRGDARALPARGARRRPALAPEHRHGDRPRRGSTDASTSSSSCVDGEDLKQLLEREGRLSVRRALELAIEVGAALAFAHERRRAPGRQAAERAPERRRPRQGDRLRDRPLARPRRRHADRHRPGDEQLRRAGAGQRSGGATRARDVYSLGVVLYELLTGSVPFSGDSFVVVALQHVSDPPPSVLEQRPEVPLRVAAAVERALEKDPDDRFPTMDDVRRRAARLPGGARLRSGRGPDRDPAGRPRRSRPRAPGGSAGVAVERFSWACSWPCWRPRPSGPSSRVTRSAATSARPARRSGSRRWGHSIPRRTGVPGENDSLAAFATDGNPGSYWSTETYGTFSKDGVGLVLDAGTPAELSRLTVSSTTPGFEAEIKAGSSRTGPFDGVSLVEGGRRADDVHARRGAGAVLPRLDHEAPRRLGLAFASPR